MITNIIEILTEDIVKRIGVPARPEYNAEEAVQKIGEDLDSLPRIDLYPIARPLLEPLTFEAHYADGTIKQTPYDIDHIPVEVSVAPMVIASTLQETEDIAFNLRTTYSGNTDAGALMFPIDNNGTCAFARYKVKQVRTPVTEVSSFAATLIDPTEDGIKVPIPYPHDDLRASLSDHPAITRLFISYFYYMYILENDALEKIINDYSKLFTTKAKAAGSKRGLFNKLRENQLAANLLDSTVAQKLTGENIKKLADDLQAGCLNEDEFNAYFRTVIPIVPDLYERALRREPAESVLSAANVKLGEVRGRSDAIANSLGIEENPGDDVRYKPRSFEAAAAYIQALGELDDEASAEDVVEAYKQQLVEQVAAEQVQQNALQEQIGNILTAKLEGKSAIGAALGLGLGASAVAGSGRSARKNDKPDLIGSAGCARSKGAITCIGCPLVSDCARG